MKLIEIIISIMIGLLNSGCGAPVSSGSGSNTSDVMEVSQMEIIIDVNDNKLTAALADSTAAKELAEKLKVTIRAFAPDHRSRDADNILKCLLDSLTKARVWGDDRQIFDLRVIKGYDRNQTGYVEVSVSEIGEQDEL